MSNTPNTYLTIDSPSEGLYKDKGSRFLSFAEPINNVEEAKERIAYYRKEYYDARHCCYAYVLGAGEGDSMGCMGTEYRANDDGEPSGTAGRPILGQINANKLTNILVVVIRYFGGVLLGTGGLIVAYKESTKDALGHANIIRKDVLVTKQISFSYEKMSDVMRTIRDTQTKILSQEYSSNGHCTMLLEIKKTYEGRF
ncbi:MAG: YigZ family protein [Paludibacteraceae bacterium]|nr:YigZ family protein [Paludibacteraceae bacterium]